MTQVKTNNAPQQQYRILRSNETVQKGDEFRSDSSWLDCRSTIGQTVQQNVDVEPQTFDIGSFRRPLPIIPGYRYLEEGDVIQEGDEYKSIVNLYPSISINYPITIQDVGTYRRKLAAPKPPTDTKPSTYDDGFVRVQTKGGSFMMKLYPTFFQQRVKICSTPDNDSFEWETEDAEAHSDTDFGTLDQCMQDIRDAGFTGRVEIVSKAFDK
jgi:hypothetical protein